MREVSSAWRLCLKLSALGLLLWCLFWSSASPEAAAQEGSCIDNCDSNYTSCRDGCYSNPFLTPEQRSACLQGCGSTYGGCSTGCFDPQCHRNCGIQMQACFGMCQADYDVCYYDCNGDTSCINVCQSNKNVCNGFCQAADWDCRAGCDGGQ